VVGGGGRARCSHAGPRKLRPCTPNRADACNASRTVSISLSAVTKPSIIGNWSIGVFDAQPRWAAAGCWQGEEDGTAAGAEVVGSIPPSTTAKANAGCNAAKAFQ
jgi:hypothetical protein